LVKNPFPLGIYEKARNQMKVSRIIFKNWFNFQSVDVPLFVKRNRKMKVEPSGVIFSGVCQIQTSICAAKEPKPITALWVPPGRTQIDICGACLDEKLRLGEWKIEGSK
jgi:hypothetical protein